MDFRILGPIEVVDGAHPLDLGGEKLRALLAVLLLSANEVVSRDRLLEDLWGEKQPRSGATALRVRIAELRRKLGPDRVETHSPGYLLRVRREELDLARFERLVEAARGTAATETVRVLDQALALWRGPPLADVAYEPFAQMAIGRLEELRLAAIERRAEARLALGATAELVGELRALVSAHPFREQFRAQLMLALYSTGRQVEALSEYRSARDLLAEELGIEPGRALRELEHRILRHDPELVSDPETPEPMRTVLVVSSSNDGLDALVTLVEPLASREARELALIHLVEREGLATATERMDERRAELERRGVSVRGAAASSADPAQDVVRLANEQNADLIVLAGEATADVTALLETAPCDVALLAEARQAARTGPGRPILVPFSGAEHDWAGVELAAWLARATDAPLVLAGSATETKDASRLLASASLILQRAVGVSSSPLLVEPGLDGLVAAAADAALVVFGLSRDWRRKGFGEVRIEVARRASVPTLFVRKGLRPGGLAPAASHTRFTWTVTAQGGLPPRPRRR